MKRFSIIIPTLNEGDNILPLLQRLETMSSANRLRPEIIFVDDDSDDATCDMVGSYTGFLDVRLIVRENQRGLAGAVVSGAQAASHEFLVVMDADLSHQPENIPDIIEPLFSDSADMVIGSRYLDKAVVTSWPVARRIGSLAASFPARLLTGITDPLSGFFATRTERLKHLPTDMTGFKIGLELLMERDFGFHVVEIPITFANRENGISKMKLAVVSSYAAQLVRISRLSIPGTSIGAVTGLGLAAMALDIGFVLLFSAVGHLPATAHIFSYLLALHGAYLLCYFLNKGDMRRGSAQYRSRSYPRFLFFVTAVLFLRGGMMALLIPDLTMETTGLLALLAVTTGGTWICSIPVFLESFVFRQKKFGLKPVVVLLVIYTVCLRILYMGSAELIQEEAYYWNYAQHLAWGYLDHPPGVAVLIRFGTQLFGTTEFGVRFGAILCWAAASTFVWGLTRSLFDRRAALLSLIFTTILPVFFGTSLLMTPDAPLIACWAGSLFFFQRALVQHKPYSWVGGGICLGFGLFSKYTIAFLGPSLIFFMVADQQARRYFFSPLPYLSAMLALLIFSPVIVWNYANEWTSFLFQSQGRLASSPEFSLHELVASIVLLITPVGVFSLCKTFASSTKSGVARGNKTKDSSRNRLFVMMVMVIPLSFFVMFSIFREIKLNWTAPIWIAAVPVFAHAILGTRSNKNLPWYHEAKLWPGMIVFLLIFYGGFLHFFTLGLPGLPFPKETFMIGWQDLAAEVDELVQTSENITGHRPVVVGMDKYRVASGLAFYRSSLAREDDGGFKDQVIKETTGRHLFGSGSLMYSHWHQPDLFNLKDIIVVSSNAKELNPSVFKQYSGTLGPLDSIIAYKHGKEVGPLYFRHLEKYRPRQAEVTRK